VDETVQPAVVNRLDRSGAAGQPDFLMRAYDLGLKEIKVIFTIAIQCLPEWRLCVGRMSMIGGTMSMTRRDTLAGAIALLCGLGAAEAKARAGMTGQPSPPRGGTQSEPASGGEQRVDLVFKQDLPNLTMDDWEVSVAQVDFPPGIVGKVHHHTGFVLAYVLEGRIVSKVSGQEEKTYLPGEMFYEPPGSTHEVSNNASESQPAKLLALIFAKKGVQLTKQGPA